MRKLAAGQGPGDAAVTWLLLSSRRAAGLIVLMRLMDLMDFINLMRFMDFINLMRRG